MGASQLHWRIICACFVCKIASGFLGVGLLCLIASVASAQGNPEREAYYGETHVHTSWSFDAYIFGNTITGPADAYKYAKGEPIKHPLGYDDQDHDAARLDGRDRPLGIRRHGPAGQRAGLARSASCRSPKKLKRPRQPADIQRIYLLLGRLHGREEADQGADQP